MSRVARAQDGYVSSLMRARTRARHAGGAAMPDRPATALLVMDMQNGIVERFGDAVIEPAARAIAAARQAGVPVIYARVEFRPGHPEISPRPAGSPSSSPPDPDTGRDPGLILALSWPDPGPMLALSWPSRGTWTRWCS